MKRIFTFFVLFFIFNISITFAKDSSQKTEEEIKFTYPYEYRVITNEIRDVTNPYQTGDYIVFTAEDGPHHVGIAFDFEDYKTIHSYKRKTLRDMDGNVTSTCYFYILEFPKNIDRISYRLIIDGIWTTDPSNFNKSYNPYTGIEVSTLNITDNHVNETKKSSNGIHFIYQGKSGQKIRLAGTFTNWDSSIYTLQETRPGYYELYLPLPQGTYYYAFYNGTQSFVDTTNPDRAWSTEGRETSKIVVQ